MSNAPRKFKQALFFLQLMIWTIISIVGCGGSENIPPIRPLISRPLISRPLIRDKVKLTWDVVPNATSYNIYWSDKPGVTKKNGTKVPNVKNPHEMHGLKKGKRYYFVITAVNASGESEESEEISCIVGK